MQSYRPLDHPWYIFQAVGPEPISLPDAIQPSIKVGQCSLKDDQKLPINGSSM